MIEFRLNKKEKQKRLVAEHERLEREMKTLAETRDTHAPGTGSQERSAPYQNLALREEVTRCEKFTAVVLEASEDSTEGEESNLLPSDETGWRVGEGDTSFYFHPFTRDEVDAEMRRFEVELAGGMPSLSLAGTFLGWGVYHAPLIASTLDGTRLVARTRVTKRLRCSLDVHTQMSYTKQKDLSPMIVTPIGWGLHQRGKASTHVLQDFDQDTLVFARDIPGPEKRIRYLFQVRRAQWELADGRRKLTASLAIIDSDANRRSRDAEMQDNVEWATEGGIQVSVTEMDENSIKVACDHWASCESKLHAEYLMIQWTQFAMTLATTKRAVGRNIMVFASEVPVISALNPYRKIEDVFLDVWRRTNPSQVSSLQKHLSLALPSPEEKMQAIVQDLGAAPAISELIQEASKAKTIHQVATAQAKVAEVVQFVTSTMHKGFGVKQETAGIEQYQEKTKVVIDGRADGKVIEVKNRLKRFMNPLPKYDIAQLQTYLYILDVPEGELLRETVRAAFACYDEDSSGWIDAAELRHLVSDLGGVLTERDFHKALHILDQDRNGVIDRDEFTEWWVGQPEGHEAAGEVGKVLTRLKDLGRQRFRVDIHTACWNGYADVVERLVEDGSELVHDRDSSEYGVR
ncbi:hypothetical protein PInf_029359 [Phytophthora infestans]|nr:hypothetical protein PInf_029359 [Phytophthora infestans]